MELLACFLGMAVITLRTSLWVRYWHSHHGAGHQEHIQEIPDIDPNPAASERGSATLSRPRHLSVPVMTVEQRQWVDVSPPTILMTLEWLSMHKK